ncbi:peptidoglycan-binding protein [Roseibaca sp. V10]|uniref:Peptidoglycan-binding protein n=2 Tax=Roseinatronobacter TaxID=121820 RepID=A0ABT0M199_9RHOB|nr:peptidoglycan-binding domain-containing protein [Roseibaca domitiana]MCL1628069.1 peptidoglycan-binding protein [Roseibaca domitiana]
MGAYIAPESVYKFLSMEHKDRHNRFLALHIGAVVALTAMAHADMASAADPGATRARVETASLSLPASPNRACWARYSVNGAAPANGVIEETAFRVPCPETVNSVFVASLQRALHVRDYYAGPITGQPDAATRDAVRAFQRDNGFDSPILTLETAQRLGLSPRDFGQN